MPVRSSHCLALSVAVAFASPVLADTWTLDKDHTEVRFTWDHLGLSRQGGRFTAVSGTVQFDPESPASGSVEVSIPLASISTGVAKLDEHLVASKEFFDVEAHPAITFRSTAVTMKSDRTFSVVGDLTINGIARPATLDVIWNFTGPHPLANINPTYTGLTASGFSATTQIRRSDWGITRTIPYVSDEIRISIETEMLSEGAKPDVAGDGEAPRELGTAAATQDGSGEDTEAGGPTAGGPTGSETGAAPRDEGSSANGLGGKEVDDSR